MYLWAVLWSNLLVFETVMNSMRLKTAEPKFPHPCGSCLPFYLFLVAAFVLPVCSWLYLISWTSKVKLALCWYLLHAIWTYVDHVSVCICLLLHSLVLPMLYLWLTSDHCACVLWHTILLSINVKYVAKFENRSGTVLVKHSLVNLNEKFHSY